MKKLFTLAIASVCFIAVSAQPSISRDVISSAGGYSTSSEGSLSWTLGETVVETVTSSAINLILTQGFQQPEPEELVIGIRELPKANVFVSLYPNPTAQAIRMDVKYDNTSRITIELVDMLGRVLNADNLDVLKGQMSNYQLDVSTLASGMYMFRLVSDGQTLNSYKFQKTN